MGGIPERFPVFPPTISTIVVGSDLCSRTRGLTRSVRSGHTEGHTAPTVGLRIGCGSRRGNPSDGMLEQEHSSAFLLGQDVGWAPARNLEFSTKPTVEIH